MLDMGKGIKIIILLFYLFSNSSCTQKTQSREVNNIDFLFGTWIFEGIPESQRLILQKDSISLVTTYEHNQQELFRYGYSFIRNNDSIFIETHENHPSLRILIILLNENNAVIAYYKGGMDTKNHFSNIHKIKKVIDANNNSINKEFFAPDLDIYSKDIFIIPDCLSGVIAFVYDQYDGLVPYIDNNGNRVYSIDSCDFFIKLKYKPDLVNFMYKNIFFSYKTSQGTLQPLSVYSMNDTIDGTIDTSNKHIFLVGFDRIKRSRFNEIVGDKIKGNILFAKIGKNNSYSIKLLVQDSLRHKGRYLRFYEDF